MATLHFSDDDGKSFRPLNFSNVPKVAEGGYIDNVESLISEISGNFEFKTKKRHTSRKYKKKHFLLKKQHKRLVKSLSKAINKVVRASNISSISVNGLAICVKRLNNEMEKLNGKS